VKTGARHLAAAAVLAAAAAASAGDGAPPPPAAPAADVYAAALARARAVEQQLVTTVEQVCQSSVSVTNLQIPKERPGQPVSREPVPFGAGSGVLVTRSGKTWILTNVHVIDGADKIHVVTPDGVTRDAVVEDTVKQYDIALLRFADPKTTGLKCVQVVGKKSAELEEGQWCLATGNPFNLGADGAPAVSLGVISGLDRVLGGEGSKITYGRAIQHDAAVNHGNSGGPLWNMKGEFVGINGMITSIPLVDGAVTANTGASYAIPVEEIEAFLGRLVDSKKDAQAAFLGVTVETDTDKAGKPIGARVTALDARSPANGPKGLKVNDVIESISCGGKLQTVKTESELVNALAVLPAGSKVLISYKRLGKQASWSGELAASQ
jgi:putative serine protease PepD